MKRPAPSLARRASRVGSYVLNTIAVVCVLAALVLLNAIGNDPATAHTAAPIVAAEPAPDPFNGFAAPDAGTVP